MVEDSPLGSTSGNSPAVPEADAKDWTWVLDRPCPDCGFDAAALDRERIADALRASAVGWLGVLDPSSASAGRDVRLRPEPTVWSPLEYAAHCRDVYDIFANRLALMLQQDDPQFANWDQDVTAVENRYWESDPAVVSAELGAAADAAVAAFGAVRGEQWQRTGPPQQRIGVHRRDPGAVLRARPGAPLVRRRAGRWRSTGSDRTKGLEAAPSADPAEPPPRNCGCGCQLPGPLDRAGTRGEKRSRDIDKSDTP